MLQVARLAPNLLHEAAEHVLQFQREQFNEDGGAKDRAGNSDLYYTVFALESLIALQADLPEKAVGSYLTGFGEGEGLEGEVDAEGLGEEGGRQHLRRRAIRDDLTLGEHEGAIGEAAALIRAAKHPLLLVGAGANRKRIIDALEQFVSKTGMPYFNTQMGKGVIGGFHDFDALRTLRGIHMIVPTHCTRRKCAILARYPTQAREGAAGMELEWGMGRMGEISQWAQVILGCAQHKLPYVARDIMLRPRSDMRKWASIGLCWGAVKGFTQHNIQDF